MHIRSLKSVLLLLQTQIERNESDELCMFLCRYVEYVEQAYVDYLREQNRPDEVYILFRLISPPFLTPLSDCLASSLPPF